MAEFARVNTLPKYVVSTTMPDGPAPWGDFEPVTVLRSVEDVRRLKDEGDGGPILVNGSGTLARGLAAAGLVDRYHLLVFPVVLGQGRTLFAGEGPKINLDVAESQTYGNGVTKLVLDVRR